MSRFNSDTWLLKCQFAAFNLKKWEHQATSTMKQVTFYSFHYFNPKFQIPRWNTTVLILTEGKNGEWWGKKITSFLSINQDCWIQRGTKHHSPWTSSVPSIVCICKMAPLHSDTLSWQKLGAGRTPLAFFSSKRVLYTCAAIITLAKGPFLEVG